MRDILPDVERWHAEEKRVALATVVQTWRSSARRAGSKMAIASDGQFWGSVSGGCVENAVIETMLDSIKTRQAQFLHFGIADETAWEVGLACGGSIDVFIKPIDIDFFQSLRAAWTDKSFSVHGTVIRGWEHILGREILIREDRSVRGSIDDHRQKRVLELSNEIFQHGKSQRVVFDEETELSLEFISPSPTLIAVGGIHITMVLMSLAKAMGYRTIVIDPRSAWGNAERFPSVGQLIQAWPENAFKQLQITRSTAIARLTHDSKLDDPSMKIALPSPAFYVGAWGSKPTNAKRRERLLNEGINESQLARLHAPIGLDIGTETPEEIALAIMSEVVEAYRKQNLKSADREAEAQPYPAKATHH